MAGVTLSIAFFASLLVLCLRPARAFAVYVICLLVYPTFLTVSVGTIDFKLGRIVITVLLLRCLANGDIRKRFKWCPLDSWMFFSAGVGMVVPFISYHLPFRQILESCAGGLMDSIFAYLAARFCIVDRSALVTTIKWIGIAIIPLALLGIIESCTGWMPFMPLRKYCPWNPTVGSVDARFGFFRATGPSGHPITFGASFAMFVPLIYCLKYVNGFPRKLCYFMTTMAVLGTISSMSSGPWMMLLVIIGCMILEQFKQWIKPLIIYIVFSCIVVSIISNRTFYHVLASYVNPLGGGGWHRAKLIDLAIEHFGEWWLLGYGGRDPGWGPALGMEWTDITNQYITDGVLYGIMGVISLIGILVTSLRMLVTCHKTEKDPILRSWTWALGSLIVGLMISFNSFTLFAQSGTIFICILGMVASLYSFSLLSHPTSKRALVQRL